MGFLLHCMRFLHMAGREKHKKFYECVLFVRVVSRRTDFLRGQLSDRMAYGLPMVVILAMTSMNGWWLWIR